MAHVRESLKRRTAAAHRAYLDGLVVWERAMHSATCPICRPAGVSAEEQELRCEYAEAEKERRRVVFRDLCDELGYVPATDGAALPAEDQAHCPHQNGVSSKQSLDHGKSG